MDNLSDIDNMNNTQEISRNTEKSKYPNGMNSKYNYSSDKMNEEIA